jgi:hypothetical protein
VNDAAVGPDAARIVVDPGASALVPPTDASVMRTCTSLPSNVPLICTVKFCARKSFTLIPGTFVHEVDVVVAGVVTATQSTHDARVPITVVARLRP